MPRADSGILKTWRPAGVEFSLYAAMDVQYLRTGGTWAAARSLPRLSRRRCLTPGAAEACSGGGLPTPVVGAGIPVDACLEAEPPDSLSDSQPYRRARSSPAACIRADSSH
jgi:hypothetical protein